MSIKVIEQPDIYLTPGELARLSAEYQKVMMFYAGPPITFEEWVRSKGYGSANHDR